MAACFASKTLQPDTCRDGGSLASADQRKCCFRPTDGDFGAAQRRRQTNEGIDGRERSERIVDACFEVCDRRVDQGSDTCVRQAGSQ